MPITKVPTPITVKGVARRQPRSGRVAVGQQAFLGFFRDIRTEMRKVVWPTRQEAINLTLVVIAMCLAVGFFLGGVDYLFAALFQMILRVAGIGA